MSNPTFLKIASRINLPSSHFFNLSRRETLFKCLSKVMLLDFQDNTGL